ncbi:hypothetical protein KIN20_036645 [Parelaphostrongylus tenuis]|uniref:Uncharacterized protein n=1 Tax=Parelaphostrongylus tenuis TaxID=148309 RepID=A0AAD5RDB8_PARTN|nr:hypothetical protein KIN20_036645 [Parelaphostrongylus tenuis]
MENMFSSYRSSLFECHKGERARKVVKELENGFRGQFTKRGETGRGGEERSIARESKTCTINASQHQFVSYISSDQEFALVALNLYNLTNKYFSSRLDLWRGRCRALCQQEERYVSFFGIFRGSRHVI